jgi:hypothetical protein
MFEPVRLAAAAAGLRIERRLYADADETPRSVPGQLAARRTGARSRAADGALGGRALKTLRLGDP